MIPFKKQLSLPKPTVEFTLEETKAEAQRFVVELIGENNYCRVGMLLYHKKGEMPLLVYTNDFSREHTHEFFLKEYNWELNPLQEMQWHQYLLGRLRKTT